MHTEIIHINFLGGAHDAYTCMYAITYTNLWGVVEDELALINAPNHLRRPASHNKATPARLVTAGTKHCLVTTGTFAVNQTL
jgi:hypothetical protein